jgi:hypothetical protein
LAGSTGTAIANLSVYPLSLITTRLQVQRQLRSSSGSSYDGILDAADKIYDQEGGIAAFYQGVLQDTGKSIADSFLFFLFYEYIRKNRLRKHGLSATTLPVVDELAVGALAGACSKFFTTPIANIVTRKQTAKMVAAGSSGPYREPSVSDIAAQIRDEKGLQGFWSGYSASLILTLNPSITFFLYESFKRTLLPRSQRDSPPATATFLMAAISKAVASTITYPFSLAKSRAQVGSKPAVNPQAAHEIKAEAAAATTLADKPLGEREAEAKKAASQTRRSAAHATVFTTIMRIYRTEGIGALYEGVWGEILKGFFSHGITMLVKETVHKTIIQLYYYILRLLNRFPSPSEAVGQAQDAVSGVNNSAQEAVAKGGQYAQDAYERAASTVQSAYQGSTAKVGSVVGNATEKISTVGQSQPHGTENRSKVNLGDAYEKAAVIGYNQKGGTGPNTVGPPAQKAENVIGETKEQGNVRQVYGKKGAEEN